MKKGILIGIMLIMCLGAYNIVVSPTVYTDKCDPNDGIYKFIPPAPNDWTERFGDNERTRLIHSISELRVVVANQGKRIIELEDPNGTVKD